MTSGTSQTWETWEVFPARQSCSFHYNKMALIPNSLADKTNDDHVPCVEKSVMEMEEDSTQEDLFLAAIEREARIACDQLKIASRTLSELTSSLKSFMKANQRGAIAQILGECVDGSVAAIGDKTREFLSWKVRELGVNGENGYGNFAPIDIYDAVQDHEDIAEREHLVALFCAVYGETMYNDCRSAWA
jgi:hypothetical protein